MRNKIAQYWILSLVVKLIFSFAIDIAPDESYYWMWAQRLDLSYFDHPPMVAWWATISKNFAPTTAVRWPFLVLGHLSFLFIYKSIKLVVEPEKHLQSFQSNLFSPLLFFASFLITPDSPFLLFWSVSLYLYLRLLHRPNLSSYCFLGIALGLSFCSKYMTVLFIPAVLLSLCFKEVRERIVWKYIPVTILIGILGCAPVLIWNYQHDWISFRFQINHGLGRNWKPAWTWNYLWSQPLIFSPFLFFELFRKPKQNFKSIYFFAVFPILFFLYSTTKGFVESNWTLMAFPAGYILATGLPRYENKLKRTFLLWKVVYGLVLSFLVFVFVAGDGIKLPRNSDAIHFENINNIVRDQNLSPETTFMSSYQMASLISFKNQKMFSKLPGINRVDDFDIRPMYKMPAQFKIFVENDFQPKHVNILKNYSIESETKVDSRFKLIQLSVHE